MGTKFKAEDLSLNRSPFWDPVPLKPSMNLAVFLVNLTKENSTYEKIYERSCAYNVPLPLSLYKCDFKLNSWFI